MAINMKKLVSSVLAGCLLASSTCAMADDAGVYDDSKPTPLAMYTDLLFMRPLGLTATVVGSVAYVVALPFTLASGGATEAGSVLVAEPALFTFYRCLGCTRTGYNRNQSNTAEESR